MHKNEPFPVTVMRDVGGYQVQEIQSIDYPFFVDIRPDGMKTDSMMTSSLVAVTMNWASPVTLDAQKNADRETETLIFSSENSWLTDNVFIQPDFDTYPELGFAVGESFQSSPLTVSIKGSFESYFIDKPSPFEEEAAEEESSGLETEAPAGLVEDYYTRIDQSPPSSRLVVFGSATFIDDFVLQLSAQVSSDRYLNSLQFFQNGVDWAVEDLDLLSIRSRGTHTRVLKEMDDQQRNFWEWLNYGVALVVLLGIYIAWQYDKRHEKPLQLLPVGEKKIEEEQND